MICLRKPNPDEVVRIGKSTRHIRSTADVWQLCKECKEKSDWSEYFTMKMYGICPLSLITQPDMELYQDVGRFLSHHVLPYSGGFLDQPADFCQAVDIVSAEQTHNAPRDAPGGD